MGSRRQCLLFRLTVRLLLTAICALALGACGEAGKGDSDSGAGSKAVAPGVPTSRGGDNSIQRWGFEASARKREQLTAVVVGFLRARVRAEWARACAYLAAAQRHSFAELVHGRGTVGCAEAMERIAAQVPAKAFADEAAIADVLSLRVGGGRGFLIYTRRGGKVYATALREEGGAWRIVSAGATALG